MSAVELSPPRVEGSGPRDAAGAAKGRWTSTRVLWDPKVHTTFWLGALTKASDVCLRSSAFLKVMHYGMRAAIGVKRLQDRALAKSFPLAFVQNDGGPSRPPRVSKEG